MVKVLKVKIPKPRLPDPMLPRQFRITRFKRETSDTFSMEFEPVSENKAFNFEPGQFNMLYIFGVGEIPISISGDPTCPGSTDPYHPRSRQCDQSHERSEGGRYHRSAWAFGQKLAGKVAEGNDVIIVTGGIGLAPLRPVIYYMMAHREKFGKIVLLCGTRTPNDLIYRRELEKWRSRLDMEVHITVDRATTSWRGNVGVVTTLIGKAPFDHLKCIAMVCGPEIMMRFTPGTAKTGRGHQKHLCFNGKKHEMRNRPLRTLSDRFAVCLQGRPGLLL
jgi:NAD(P)H-flavin reductase